MINMKECCTYNDETGEDLYWDRPKKEIEDMCQMFDDMLWLGRHLATYNVWYDDYINSENKTKIDIANSAMKARENIIQKYKDEPLFKEYMYEDCNWSRLLGIVETLRWVLGLEWGMLDS